MLLSSYEVDHGDGIGRGIVRPGEIVELGDIKWEGYLLHHSGRGVEENIDP